MTTPTAPCYPHPSPVAGSPFPVLRAKPYRAPRTRKAPLAPPPGCPDAPF